MKLKSFFAAPERNTREKIAVEIDQVSNNEFISGLMHTISGILAIVNDKRQVLAVNESFIKFLGIRDPGKQLGLRPGEILQCIHSDEQPGGCGTAKHCRTCGAAISMVTSLSEKIPTERICALQVRRGEIDVDIVLSVRAQPIKVNSSTFLILFIQDITRQQQQAAIERTFFHDINNLMSMLVGASEILQEGEASSLAETVHRAALRLQSEIAIQRYLSEGESQSYKPMWQITQPVTIFKELDLLLKNHPAAQDIDIVFLGDHQDTSFKTDISLLLRILCNMLINACEATEKKGRIKLWLEKRENALTFSVWNEKMIKEDVQERIFTRNFSTKSETGRGIGTYSMKLFGEKILGGKMQFSSNASDGTIFSLTLPI